MSPAIYPSQTLRSQREFAPLLIVFAEANVEIAVNEQEDCFVERPPRCRAALALVKTRFTGLQFTNEKFGPLGDLGICILLEFLESLNGSNSTQLLNGPQRIPADLAIRVVLDRIAQQFHCIVLVAIGILKQRLFAHHWIRMIDCLVAEDI